MNVFEAAWDDRRSLLPILLLPLSGLFCLVSFLRRRLYRWGLLKRERVEVPVIIVGNLSVGGTGKTPLVIWLVRTLRSMGFTPGIITRGYGGQSESWPVEVTAQSSAEEVGDEAVLLKRQSDCPVYAAPRRIEAARQLLSEQNCDVIVSDDGLQHYALHRDLEIVVIDGYRRFGNGYCLPAGPLRELPSRLKQVDLVIVNGDAGPDEFAMQVAGDMACALDGRQAPKSLVDFASEPVHAVAGIGRPERFFAMLEAAGLQLHRHPFPDHHAYREADLQPFAGETVLMTEKDAVKCESFANERYWYVPAEARVDPGFEKQLKLLMRRLRNGQKTA
ncbi:MAG: tetraacyldisaccharide 4'-kinase [Candidatus Thiodiazotropha sp.]